VEALGITVAPDDSMDGVAKLVVDILGKRTATHPNVLLVYDNAESYSDIEPWLPSRGSACHSIVTTRNSRGCSPSSTIGVGPLDKDSAFRVIEHLIARRLASQELPEVTTILEGFVYLPLAIVLFAQLIRVEGVEDAVAMVRDQTQEVLESDIELDGAYGGEGRQSVWSVCRAQIKGVSKVALRLLFCLSFLDADHVPKQLLKHFITNPLKLSKTTRELTSRSLAQVSSEDGSVSTHRLIQLNARDFIDANATIRTEVMESIGAAVLQTMQDVDFQLGRQNKTVTDILPHLKTLNHHWMVYDDSSATLGRLKYYLGEIYVNDARYDLALVEYRESLRIDRAAYGKEHPEVAATLHSMGSVYESQGQYERALDEYRESLRIDRAAYGNDHPNVAAALMRMGIVYYSQGQYERAMEGYRESFRINRAAYGNEHPSVAATLHSMGNVYFRQGHYERALDEFHESLRIYRAVYGNDHPIVAVTLHSMGNVYQRQLDEYRESLRIDRSAYCNDHPSVAVTLHSIGDVYEVQGHFERALDEYRESLRIMQVAYGNGNEHPSVPVMLHNMGRIYYRQGHYDRALVEYRESLRIDRAAYGNEHPSVAATLCSMGKVYQRQGLHERALDEYREALRIERAAYGNDHPCVAVTLYAMGDVYSDQGQYERALEEYRESLRIRQAAYGNDHPSVAATLHNMGRVYERQGHYERALDEYREALRMHRLFHQTGHPVQEIMVKSIAALNEKISKAPTGAQALEG
jgi:tetratricopeptide (TPR) repeat protein